MERNLTINSLFNDRSYDILESDSVRENLTIPDKDVILN